MASGHPYNGGDFSPYPSGAPPRLDEMEPSIAESDGGKFKVSSMAQSGKHGDGQQWHQASNRWPDTYVPVHQVLQEDAFASPAAGKGNGEGSKHGGDAKGRTSADEFVKAAQKVSEGAQNRSVHGWSRVRLHVQKEKAGFTSNRGITSQSKTLKRNIDHKAPEPDETAEAYTMLLETESHRAHHTKTLADGPRNRKKEKKEKRARVNRANRLASEIAAAKQESMVAASTVSALQSYIVGNSYIKVFSLDDEYEGDKETDELTNKHAARQLGYYLFWNLRAGTSGLALTEADVEESARRAGLKHAESAWQLLDRNGDSEASLDEVVHAVEDVYDNRRTLAATLQDNQTVVSQVERLIWLTLIVLLVFIGFAIFDSDGLQRTWTGLSASLLSFSFIFSNSIRTVFENAIWLFFTHPFDVGDVVNYEDNRYKVCKIKLQYVVLDRVDGAHVIVPTNEMSTARIHNVTRSDLAWQGITMTVDITTTTDHLERVATEIVANIKLNPKWYGGDYRIWLSDSSPGFKLELAVYYNHSGCGLDLITMGLARTHMLAAVTRGLQAAGVQYTLPPTQGGKGGDDNGVMLQRLQAVEPTGSGDAGGGGGRNDAGNQTAGAAAANLLLLS